MKLLVVRHGLTEANKQHLLNGRHDEVLSEEGRREIPSLVEKLRPYKFEVIYSSPLKRAMETAMPIAEDRGLEINVDRRIIEIEFGMFTLKPYESTVEIFGKKSPELLNTYAYDLRPYGGEAAEQVSQRIQEFLDDIKASARGPVLVVTHGGIIRWFHYLCNGEKVGKSPNLSVHEFEI